MKNKKPTRGRKPIELTLNGSELTKRDRVAEATAQKAIWDAQANALKARKHPAPTIIISDDGKTLTRNSREFRSHHGLWVPTKTRSGKNAAYTLAELRTQNPYRQAKRRIAYEARIPTFVVTKEPVLSPRPLSPEAQAAVDRVRKLAADREARLKSAETQRIGGAINGASEKIAWGGSNPYAQAVINSTLEKIDADIAGRVERLELYNKSNNEAWREQWAKPTFSRLDFYGTLLAAGIITGILRAAGWL